MDGVFPEDVLRFTTGPDPCAYLPQEMASAEYRVFFDLSPKGFGELLRRGWRRFGRQVFRPTCANCAACRTIRVNVARFEPSKSQRRTLRRNAHIEVVVQQPTVTHQHLELYNAYHADMHHRRGWPLQTISEGEYRAAFLDGDWSFAREFLYFDDGRLVGVGLVDVVPGASSSVYFFHDPVWRPMAPGVFSLLAELWHAREHGLAWHYLGYWIAQCPSMAYKSQYRPHELLVEFVADDEEPVWKPAATS